MTKRAKTLGTALVAGLFVGAVTVGTLTPANAQSGSRICGHDWTGTTTAQDGSKWRLHYTLAIETPNFGGDDDLPGNAQYICRYALSSNNTNHSLDDVQEWKDLAEISWDGDHEIWFETCEDFGRNEAGGRFGDDPCNDMSRMETIFESKPAEVFYWKEPIG